MTSPFDPFTSMFDLFAGSTCICIVIIIVAIVLFIVFLAWLIGGGRKKNRDSLSPDTTLSTTEATGSEVLSRMWSKYSYGCTVKPLLRTEVLRNKNDL